MYVGILNNSNSANLNPDDWYLDSAYTVHTSNKETNMTDIEDFNGSLIIADDKKLDIEKKKGSVCRMWHSTVKAWRSNPKPNSPVKLDLILHATRKGLVCS